MLELDFSPFPIIGTDRLILRELTMDDVPAVFAIRSDPRVMQFIGRPLGSVVTTLGHWTTVLN